MVANAWMRSGNTSDLNNYDAFLSETFDVALKSKVETIIDFFMIFPNIFCNF